MKQFSSRVSPFLLIALTILLSLSLCFYSIKHFLPSLMNHALKLIPLEEESASLESAEFYYQNLEEALLLAKNSSLKEKDNPDTYLELSKLCFKIFRLETEKKHKILKQINPSHANETYKDDLLMEEIYRSLYLSLRYSPSNFRPFLFLSNLANLRLNIGEGYITSESILEAQELTKHYIETALKLNPSKSQVGFAAGKHYLQMGDIERSAHHFLGALAANKNLSSKLFYETLYEPDREALLEMVLEGNAELQMLYGDFLTRQRNYKEAEKYYRLSLKLSEDKINPYRKVCKISFNLGKNEEVRSISEEMLEKKYAKKPEERAEVYHYLSLYFEHEKNIVKAIEFAKKALENDRSNIRNHYYLSRCYLKNDQIDKAISILQETLSHFDTVTINQSPYKIHFLLAEAYERNEDIVRAYREYHKALKHDPDNKEIQKRINFLKRGLR